MEEKKQRKHEAKNRHGRDQEGGEGKDVMKVVWSLGPLDGLERVDDMKLCIHHPADEYILLQTSTGMEVESRIVL